MTTNNATPREAEFPITMRNYAILDSTKYESLGAALTARGMVTQRWRSCDMSTIRIPLNSRKYPGLYALIDEDDYELVSQYSWHPLKGRTTTYARNSHGVLLHRLLAAPAKSEVVDHINHDGLDNRRVNLRACSPQENAFNMRPYSKSASRFKNVFRADTRWSARGSKDGRMVHLGRFVSEELAARVADRHQVDVYGEYAHLNFPEDLMPSEYVDEWIELDKKHSYQMYRRSLKKRGNNGARGFKKKSGA